MAADQPSPSELLVREDHESDLGADGRCVSFLAVVVAVSFAAPGAFGPLADSSGAGASASSVTLSCSQERTCFATRSRFSRAERTSS